MTRRFQRRRHIAGFSLLEMVFVVAILTLVMGVVFTQINLVQKRARTEANKVDMTQESREAMDQVVRDMHSIGYPNVRMYGTPTTSATTDDTKVAAGLVKAAYDDLWFEGDVDGDGFVDVVEYKLEADANGNCPCTLTRRQTQKQAGGSLSNTQGNENVAVSGVINSGGAGGGATGVAKYTISGQSAGGVANNTNFAAYKSANVFTYYNALGAEISAADIGSASGRDLISQIRTIRINFNVLSSQLDMQTGVAPVMSYTAAVRLPNVLNQ